MDPSPDLESATHAVAQALRDGATAIAAYNDEVAFAILAGAHRGGVSVPRDVSVMGVDNSAQGLFALPPLTSVEYAWTPYELAPQLSTVLASTGVFNLTEGTARSRVIERESVAPRTA
jgi:DNA-binding LacI/PurR family transcriptional regulator